MERKVSSEKNHPFHIVDPSILPLLCSIASFGAVVGIVFWARDMGIYVLVGSMAALTAIMYQWWSDVTSESLVPGLHNEAVRTGFRYGMVLFISSEVMFFVAFFWAYFDAAIIRRGLTKSTPVEGLRPGLDKENPGP